MGFTKVTRGLAAVALSVAAGGAALAVQAPAQAQSTTYCHYTSYQPSVSRGSTGSAVRQVQCEINRAHRRTVLSVDGQYGPATQSAVKSLQYCANVAYHAGLVLDGAVGPKTWPWLNYMAAHGWPGVC